MSYRIYRNLHRGDWTLQHYIKGKGWRKHSSFEWGTADFCTFKLFPTGRERVRQERRKNVHAFAVVEHPPITLEDDVHPDDFRISYSPYDDRGFRTIPPDADWPMYTNLIDAWSVLFHKNGLIYAQSITTSTHHVVEGS